MTKKIKLAICGFFYIFVLSAQNNENLVKNGDFEGSWSAGTITQVPEGWSAAAGAATNKEEGSRDGGTGNFYLSAYANAQGLSTELNGKKGSIDVQEGVEYELTFWHKATRAGLRGWSVSVVYYPETKEGEYEQVLNSARKFMTTTAEWTKETITMTIPKIDATDSGPVKKAGIEIYMPFRNGEKVFFDDFVLVRKGGAEPVQPKPDQPSQPKQVVAQREVELSWTKSNTPNATYEVEIDGKKYTATEPKLTIEKLNPDTNYTVKIRTVVGDTKSEDLELSVKTQPFEKDQNSLERIPYLRTINHVGQCSQMIKAYWNDLVTENATIVYTYDGKVIEPDANNMLNLTRTDSSEYWEKHILEVSINEANGRKWNLTYKLSISKN